MAYKVGKDCAVKLGSATVVGMGTWTMDGITTDQMDSSAFGDSWKSFKFGMKDGGTISFNGLYDPADTTGQIALQLANLSNTNVTSIKLYVDSTSYYEPCQTTGYFSPTNTTGFGTVLSYINITAHNVGADKSGLCTISFTAKVSGLMVLI